MTKDRRTENTLRRMGMACLVRYDREFCDLSLSVDDITNLMIENDEPWVTILDRARAGRLIVERGQAEAALNGVADSKADEVTRRLAEEHIARRTA